MLRAMHLDAAEHHEIAAKAHRTAAERDDKVDAERAAKHAADAQEASKAAYDASEAALARSTSTFPIK